MTTSPRQYPRYAHQAAITVNVGGERVRGATTNISRGGLCVALPVAFDLGITVVVEIALMFDGSQSEPLQISARTAWCTAVGDQFQLGVAFRPMDANTARYLQMFLEMLDADPGHTIEGARRRHV